MKPTRCRLVLMAIIFLCCRADGHTRSRVSAAEILPATVAYVPVEADMLVEYKRDVRNQKVQTWKQYWGWVQTFYNGNILSEGWTKFSQVTLDAVKPEEARRTVLRQLNELGKMLGQEWAKDASVRKIDTADLRRWNEAISEACRGDNGTGQQIIAVLRSIRDKARQKRGH